MKNLLFFFMTACFALTACDFETSDNGDLDGYWQLRQVDTLATGGSADMRTSGLFWSVQAKVLEIKNNNNNMGILFRFEKTDDRLRLWNPIASLRAISDSIVSNPAKLKPYYLESTPMKDGVLESILLIQKADDEEMILTNNLYRLHLRKY